MIEHRWALVKGLGRAAGVELCPWCGAHRWKAVGVLSKKKRAVSFFMDADCQGWRARPLRCVKKVGKPYYSE